MRRRAALLLLCSGLAAADASAASSRDPGRGRPGVRALFAARPSGPPHAWLFGNWTGGLFPVLDGMAPQDCRTQVTVAVGQDVVGHASLITAGMARRVIETVRTSPAGAEFRFAPAETDPSAFGCEDPNILHVARASNDTITFPRCSAFPYPLQRCPAPAPAR